MIDNKKILLKVNKYLSKNKISIIEIKKYLSKKGFNIIKKEKTQSAKSNLGSFARAFLGSLIIISFFSISPIILEFTKERSLLSNDFENNSEINHYGTHQRYSSKLV